MGNKNIFSDYNLTDEDKKKLLEEIKSYFEQERDEKIGIIASESILEFFLDTMGKYIYNKALDNTKEWYDKRIESMESDFYARYKY